MNKQLKYLAILLLATTILYLPSLKNEFNNWDDSAYILSNPNIALTKENIKKSFLEAEYHRMYAPLTALSHSLIYHFYGLNPKPAILLNLILHLCNVGLLFIFISLLIKNPFVCFFTTALFAIHPMQVESVAYAAGRRDLLYVFFYLLCIILYTASLKRRRGHLLMYILSIFFALLSLLSKGQALTIPVILILISLFSNRKWNHKSFWLHKIPFFIMTAAIAYKVFTAPQYATGGFETNSYLDFSIPVFNRLIYACYQFIQYIILLFVPYKLSLIHYYPIVYSEYIIPWYYYLYVILTACFIYFFFRYAIKDKFLWFGLTFFAANIAMLLQLIPNSYGIMNDHYVYFASVGIFLIITEKISSKYLNKKYTVVLYAFFTLYILILCYLTHQRIPVFRNSITVWTDVINKYPKEAFAYQNRGYYIKEVLKDDARALPDYDNAIRYNQFDMTAYMNRAIIKTRAGNHQSALTDLNKAIMIDSAYAPLFLNRGVVKRNLGNEQEAIRDFNTALLLNSSYDLAYINRASSKFNLKDYAGAIKDCDKAVEINKSNGRYFCTRALAKGMINNFHGAIQDLDECIRLQSDFTQAYEERARLYFLLKDYNSALSDCEYLLQVNPENQNAIQIRDSALKQINRQ